MLKKNWIFISLPIYIPIFILGLWEFLSSIGWITRSILPPPSQIFKTGVELVADGEIYKHLSISLARVFKGYFLGAGAGVVLGILIGIFASIDRALAIIQGILRPVPILAWVPLLILWLGIDEASKVAVIAIGSFWPVLLNTIQGIRGTDQLFLELTKTLKLTPWQTLQRVILPSALPAIFTGLRVGVGIAWMCVIGAELIAASSGIGYLIMFARELSQPDVMLVGVTTIGIVGFSIDYGLRHIEKWALPWNKVKQERKSLV